jgi:hypothetical protein
MAPRRPSQPPPPKIKHFTPAEIEQGITKLKRRLEDTQGIDPQHIAPGSRGIDCHIGVQPLAADIIGTTSQRCPCREQFPAPWA